MPHSFPLRRVLLRIGCTLLGLASIGGTWRVFESLADDVRRDEAAATAHWAFQPVAQPPVPLPKDGSPRDNPIDSFLLVRLEKAGLTFAPPADKRTLIRRLTFDLTGLPPTPSQVEAFLADESPRAYERLVDRLLQSLQYGEHWGRMWLDVVCYAETAGYNADPLRPHAWKYRDYVIASFNADKPFDRFIAEQIAGDELFPDDPQAVLGSGYVLMWPDESNASNILLARQDALNDLTGNVGAAFLGLSIGCAQCHDHKFDPLPQRDFYRLQAFFSGLIRCDQAAVGTTDQLVAFRRELDRWLADSQPVRDELQKLEFDARVKAAGDRRMKFPQIVLDALDTHPDNRTTLQRQLAFWSERQIEIKESDLVAHLSAEQQQRRTELRQQLADWTKRRPQPPEQLAGMIAGEIDAVPPPTYLLASGSYDKPLAEVTPGFLSALAVGSENQASIAAPHPYTSGRRSALARWLAAPKNPLVPRVIVNRLWQGHFGRGLVENANDFGAQTPPPSHPELLDYLAAIFVAPRAESQSAAGSDGSPPGQDNAPLDFSADRSGPNLGWSLKRLHRLIVTSAAYRQGSAPVLDNPGDASHTPDPDNLLYGRFPRRRLSAESLRDSLLAVSGRLNPALYGPSIFPELPPDFSKREAWKVSGDPTERQRRSIYIHAKRNLPYPLLEAFDLPDMHESCARRSQTTVAPQALLLLNSQIVLDYARAFAGRLLYDNPHADWPQAVIQAYRLAYGRSPDAEESAAAIQFLEQQQSQAEARRQGDQPLLLPLGFPKFLDSSRAAALVDLCHALLNASEFLYID
ncbi:MAG: DUF1549 and DUF1553 domain-containing protein [Planctomycetales bacterium]